MLFANISIQGTILKPSGLRASFYNILARLTAVCISLGIVGDSTGQAPIANFNATTVAGCSPLIVNFQDQSTGNPTSWNWDFGNGNTSTLQNPSASYFTPGTYNVTLTATNVNGSNAITRTAFITVYEPPSVNFSGDQLSGCFPLRVQLTDLSTAGTGNNNVSWNWDFGNGNTSTLQNPLAVYTSAGTFTVTVKITNDKGCSKTISKPNYVSVTPGVRSDFSNSQPTVCKAPANIVFTNNSTGPPILSYQWDFGDGNTSSVVSPTHTYNIAGTYTAMLVTTSSAGCQDTMRSAPIIIGGYTNTFNAVAAACADESVNFTNTSTPASAGTTWNFGDGTSGTGNVTTHVYNTPGTYTVWMYNNFGNCVDSVSQPITINARPVANFTAPVTTGCQPPLTVNFQDLSTGAVAWNWDFGDGGTSTLQNPSYIFSTYGSFSVTLIVTNANGCTDTITRSNFVTIRRAQITIPSLPLKGCIPYTHTFVPAINTIDAVTSYQWDFGDGGTSTLANPVYTYTTQGNYTVRLIITTSTGCMDTLIVPNAVRVGSKPVADFSANPIPVCGRQPVQFTDLSSTVDEWLWDFGDGVTSTIQNPIHNYNDTGYFDIRLIVTNFGCADTLIRTNYTQVLPPIARFNFIPDCNNRLRFTFNDQSIAAQSWAWDFGDGGTSALQNPIHSFPSYGQFNVRLIVTNGACADTTTQTITTVNESVNFSADRVVACKEAAITFSANSANPSNIATYTWDFGDGTVLGGARVETHLYTASGTYTVRLTTTDINGCTDVIVRTNYIRINGPIAQFDNTSFNGCTGLVATFNDQSTTDGVNALTNWTWDFGDGVRQSFTNAPFQHTYATTGSFDVTLIVTDAAGCKDSIAINNMVITTDPSAIFTSNDTLTCPNATVQFLNGSAGNYIFAWDFGDGGTSTIYAPTHTYASTGAYTVKLFVTDGNNCTDSLVRNTFVKVGVPIAGFTIRDSISSCLPFEVNFTNTSTYFTSFFWDFGPGQGTSTLRNPVHYYSLAGTYPVKLIVTSPGGCLDSLTRNIHVFDTVGSRVNYTPLGGCSPLPVDLNTFTTGPMDSFFWDFGDGYTITTNTPVMTHTYLSYGNYLPKVIMEDPSGCLIPLQGFDTVSVTGAKAKFGLDDSLFCDFGQVNFTDSSTFNDPIVSYNWSFGDGGSSNVQNPSHQYNSPGLYPVRLIVGTQVGCYDTLMKPNLVAIVQTPLTNIAGDTIVCANSGLLHNGVFAQADTSVVRWNWNFPNGNSSTVQSPPIQVYTTPGTYIVTSVATNSSGCADTTRQTIHVNPLPVVNMPAQLTIQPGFPVTIPATYSPNTVRWLWNISNGLSCVNCPTPEASPKFNTTYQVYFTDENGCSNRGIIDIVVVCKNANLFVPNTFTPNNDGNNDVFYPRGKGLERVKTLRIFNRWGEIVFEKMNFAVNDVSAGWNGTYKGAKPKADVYIYQIEVFCENGEVIRLDGNLALVL